MSEILVGTVTNDGRPPVLGDKAWYLYQYYHFKSNKNLHYIKIFATERFTDLAKLNFPMVV